MVCVDHAVQGALHLSLAQRSAGNVILADMLGLVLRAAFPVRSEGMATPQGYLHVWHVRRRLVRRSLGRVKPMIVNASKAPSLTNEQTVALLAIRRHG